MIADDTAGWASTKPSARWMSDRPASSASSWSWWTASSLTLFSGEEGDPLEGDDDFDDTMRLVDEVGFASAFSFKYSRRPGTPGAAMPDQVPEAVKSARLAALQALLGKQARDFNLSKVGVTVPVLFAEAGRKPGQIIGKTPGNEEIVANFRERHDFAPGDTIRLSADPKLIHLFKGDTGTRL